MKKILTVGYYADFSKFFKEIDDELSKLSPDYTFLHINLHLSGYLYSLLHNQHSIYLPWVAAHKNKNIKPVVQSEVECFINYHLKLNPGIDSSKLTAQAAKYYHYFESLLGDYQPDLIIVSGDSRMPVEILQYLAVKHSINIYHFEQAPLGRTILDKQGVNANCSFRDINYAEIEGINGNEPIKPFKFEKWAGYKKYRAIDLLIEKLLPFLQPVEHIRPKRTLVDNTLYQQAMASEFVSKDAIAGNIYLLVLQVPDDVNMIYHSPHFSNHFEIVKAVHQALPKGSILIVREHPLFKKMYESELYTYIKDNDDIFFDNSARLFDAMNGADVVVVNNSTVGLEAIEIGKPIVILGNAYYDRFPMCYKYDGNDLMTLLVNAASEPDEKVLALRKQYLVYLFNHCFIPGHFRDEKGIAPGNIAKWISQNVH